MSEALKNFANRDTKYNFILLIGLLIIFAISIVNAVDFRKVAIDNDAISDTYFSVSYANVLCVLNSIIAFLTILGIVYIIWKIIKGQKDIRELESDKAAMDILQAFFISSSNPGVTITAPVAGPVPVAPVAGPVPVAPAAAKPVPVKKSSTPHATTIDVEGLKFLAEVEGIDVSWLTVDSCSDGNKFLKCPTGKGAKSIDFPLNNLYETIFK
jgi:hypothetical protein